MSDKFIICPHCGTIQKEGDLYCGHCVANIQHVTHAQQTKHKQEPSYSSQGFQTQEPYQTSYASQQHGSERVFYGQPPPRSYQLREAESKANLAWVMAWLTLCLGSIVFLILTIYFANEAQRLDPNNPKPKKAIRLSVVGFIIRFLISMTLSILFFVLPILLGYGIYY